MKTRSTTRRRLTGVAALAVALGVLTLPMGAGAQPTRGKKKADTPKTESVDKKAMRLSDEQRKQVQDIMREHREESRTALREKLSKVMTPEQLEMFEQRWDGERGMKAPREKGMRAERGMRDGRHPRHGRRDLRRADRWERRGDCRGECRCDGAMRGGGMRGQRGDFRGDGPGPRMGEFRAQGGERMVEHLTVALDLSAEQQEKVAAIVREHHEQFKDFDPSTLSFEERQKTREAHRALLTNRIKEVLTPEQAGKLDELHDTMPGPRHGGRGLRG